MTRKAGRITIKIGGKEMPHDGEFVKGDTGAGPGYVEWPVSRNAFLRFSEAEQRVMLAAHRRGNRISVVAGTLIIWRFNRELYERVRRVKQQGETEKTDTDCASQPTG